MKADSRSVRKPIWAMALVLGLIASASASVTDEDREILEAFYQAANGDDWLRNDGWLESGSDPCDWYGVECESRFDIDRDIVRAVELPGNNLSGTLETRIFEIVHSQLDLSDNALEGELDRLPASPGRVDLANNLLGGNLPSTSGDRADDISGTSRPSGNWYLDLSGNDFEGEVPSDWRGPVWLSLANNRLEGMPTSLLDGSRHPLDGRFLDLSDNQFSGDLPSSMMEADLMPHNGPSRWGGGLNLCWNDWSVPESVEFRDWLRDRHVGGEFENCLSRERQPIDAQLSGSWFDLDRSGEGIVVHTLDNGTVLNYVFTFDEDGKQQWLIGAEAPDENSVSWRELLRTRGQFGSGLLEDEENSIEDRGSFRIDRLDSDRLLAKRVYIDNISNVCLAVYPPPLSCFGDSLSDRLEYQRLSQLAGTRCDNGNDFQQFSGAWYNPERNGEGFVVEVLPDKRVVVYWFTYKPDDSGDQAWMIGTGSIERAFIPAAPPPGPNPVGIAEIETIHQPLGGVFGEDFDPATVELVEWGSLTLELMDDGSAHVRWDSLLDEFGTGDYALEQLARPMLAECELEE